MASTDDELIAALRVFTNYSTTVLSASEFQTVVDRAKKHIRAERNITDSSFDFYAGLHSEEALYWYTGLFAKVAVGELDSNAVQVGAVDINDLQAEDDGNAITWLENAEGAVAQMEGGDASASGTDIRRVQRDGRAYGTER